jgi:hypothetical protein
MTKKCETCESLSTSHVEAVTQQLQQAMALHWALRLSGETREVRLNLSQAQERALDAWVSLSGHLGEHALNDTVGPGSAR